MRLWNSMLRASWAAAPSSPPGARSGRPEGEASNDIGCRAHERLLGGEAFQGAADVERLSHVVRRHRRDEGAAARPDLDQRLGFEAGEGVFDRGQADAELGGQLVHVQPLAGLEERDRIALRRAS